MALFLVDENWSCIRYGFVEKLDVVRNSGVLIVNGPSVLRGR